MGRVEVPSTPGAAPFAGADAPGRELLTPGVAGLRTWGRRNRCGCSRGPGEAPSRGPSLSTFTRSSGRGLTPERAGEAAQGQVKIQVRPGGSDITRMAEAATDAGYYPHVPDDETFWADLVADANGKRKLYAKDPDFRAQQAFEARQAAEEQNRHAANTRYGEQQDSDAAFQERQTADVNEKAAWDQHMDEVGDDPDDWRRLATGTEEPVGGGTGANAPEYEPAYQEAYTPKSLDRIRRAANRNVKFEFGKPLADEVNQANASWAQRWTQAVADDPAAVPKLRAAIDASASPKRLREILDRFGGKLTSSTDRAFKNDWLKLKGETEREIARASLAENASGCCGVKGALSGGRFNPPGVIEEIADRVSGQGRGGEVYGADGAPGGAGGLGRADGALLRLADDDAPGGL